MSSEQTIVGIGASAGGLEALQAFVRSIPNDSGLAYVIVQHLAPDHPSIMDRLLGEHAHVSVTKIEDGVRLEANHVYVIPAGPSAEVRNGRFRLFERNEEQGVRTPIDRFFRSLAEDAGRNAFAVVLSGTGSDGTLGVRAIKEAGGIALVQESGTARFTGMPDSAVATGLVDFVLPADEMPGKIIEIVQHRRMLDADGQREQLSEEIEAQLDEIVGILDEDRTVSFSGYKPGTLVRRVMRRMTLLRQTTVEGYLKTLKQSREEGQLLSQDFLIGVTEFFRDPNHFRTLAEKALRPILERETGQIRIWVPGCSTGEEAFSIAILVHEILQELGRSQHVQIFGTDVDQDALRHARHGRFAGAALKNVSDARRSEYFFEESEYWLVKPRLREMCVFAPHDLLRDPPFSRIDLISCRNLMIYLSAEAQEAVIPRFHYALNPGGYLWLGPSETLGRSERFFLTEDRSARVFCRNDDVSRAFSSLRMDATRPREMRSRSVGQTMDMSLAGTDQPKPSSVGDDAEQTFLRLYASPFAIVSRSGEVLYLSEGMTRFVKPTKGAPATNIEDFLTPELRLPVQSALDEVLQNGREADIREVVAELSGKSRLFDVFAAPFREDGEQIMIVLKDVRPSGVDGEGSGRTDDRRVAELERELVLTRRRLHTLEREFEAGEQDLRSSNEELLTMNEEMQSANEELETSREELQSINEELETINAELTENNRQLTRANSDLQNLLHSTDVATLFLDENDCVRLFTPALQDLFGVQDRDIGRRIFDLSSRLDYPQLQEDADRVRRTLEPVEREVRIAETDETFEARVRPYRTVDNRLDGVVFTFQDVTARIRNERQQAENARLLADQLSELQTLYDAAPIGLNLLDTELRFLRVNQHLAEINGLPAEEHVGKYEKDVVPGIYEQCEASQRKVLETGEPVYGDIVRGETPAEPGRMREWIVHYYPVKSGDETIAVGSCVREVTQERELERALSESEARLRRLFDNVPALISVHEGPEHRHLYVNGMGKHAMGGADVTDQSLLEAYPRLDGSEILALFDEVFRTGEPSTLSEVELPPMVDLEGFDHVRLELVPWYLPDGKTGGVMSFSFDITEQRAARDRQEILLAELQHRVKNILAIVQAIVRFAARTATSQEEFLDALKGRLAALSRTHDALTASDWTGRSIRNLVEEEVKPYLSLENGRFEYEGPDMDLDPKTALSLGLAFHELATNAAKHGALTDGNGHVRVSVQSNDGRLSRLEWRETGGPAVTPPEGEGFGTFLLKKIVAAELGASVHIDYRNGGLTYVVEREAERGTS